LRAYHAVKCDWPGFCPGPHWGSLQRSPRSSVAGFKGAAEGERRGREGKGRRGTGMEEK